MQRLLLSSAFVLSSLFCFGQVVSDFSASDEGWTVFNTGSGSSTAATYTSSGGNPANSGEISFSTLSTSVGFYFTAPAKFHGNFSAAYNQNLSFDLHTSYPGSDNSAGDVIITNSGAGATLYYQLPSKPNYMAYSSYKFQMNETVAGWHYGSYTGPAPTSTQMKLVLSNITNLQIRLKYFTGNTFTVFGYLDNVILNLSPTAPTITAVSPLSGLPGTAVTITGTNFNTTAAQNAVYFNGVKANVVNATATQLTVTSPTRISYGHISVTNLALKTQAVSSQNFNPLFDNNEDFGGRIIRATFAKKVDFGTATEIGISTGDLDGDGWTDVLTSGSGLKASVYRNLNQAGVVNASSFASPLVLSIPNNSNGQIIQRVGQNSIADMDGDGKLDLVINVGYPLGGGNWDNGMIIFLNQSTPGTLSFSAGNIFEINTVNNNNGAMSIADIDGDGRPDFMGTLNNSGCQLGIMQNLSTPGVLDFAAAQNFGLGATMGVDISFGDLTGDHRPEVIVEGYLGGVISVYENLSTAGIISMGTPFQISNLTVSNIQVADVDLDGKSDLIFKQPSPGLVHVIKNNHTSGSLAAVDFSPDVLLASLYSTGGNSVAYVGSGDVNGDNKVDIIANDGTNIVVYENYNTSGSITAASFLSGIAFEGALNSNSYVLLADVDGDNKAEIIIRPQSGANFRVYRNESFPAPQITSFSPAGALVGNSVTLTGNYFNTAGATPTTRLSGILAASSTSSNTTSGFTIPSGAESGRISITEHGLTGASKPLNLFFSTNGIINSASFGPSIDFGLSTNLRDALTIGDFDDDGKNDVGVIDNGSTGKIFHNTHATAGQPITTASLTQLGTTLSTGFNMIALDIDGDGKIDLNNGSGLLQNNSPAGSISFLSTPGGISTAAASFTSVASSDFNKDGKIDLALNTGSASIHVYENHSTKGVFVNNAAFSTFYPTAVSLAKPNGNGGVVAADFDGDGYDDLLATNQTAGNISVYLNQKQIGPITSSSFLLLGNNVTSGSQPIGLTADDFDGDGKTDIAVTYFNSAFVSVYRNTSAPGAISFATPLDIASANKGYNIASQDLDGDGKMEIVVIHQPNPGPGSFSIFQNKSVSGTLSFNPAVNYALTTQARNPQALAIADINSDQKPDILIVGNPSSGGTNALMVFENKIAPASINITTQPSATSVCVGSTATFTAAASGTTNITYQWQYSSDGVVPYADIANGASYSNVTTSVLSINTTGSFGAGHYRSKINGDFVTTTFTNDAVLTTTALPTAPVTTGASNCSSSALTLSASGGSNGQYRWYSVITGGTAISGEVNNTFTTPVLSSTTTYYVSITTGSCESNRTAVTATINTPPTAPTATGASGCPSTAIILTASGATDGQYRWYTVATGGTAISGQVNSTFTVSTLTATTSYYVSINNGTCESARTSVIATVQTCATNLPPDIKPTTVQAPIEGKVTVSLTALISDPDNNLDLSTLKVIVQPASGAKASIDAQRNLILDYTGITFSGTEKLTIEVCDLLNACTQKELSIEVVGDIIVYNGISPNTDGKNDIFLIEFIDALENTKKNHVSIYNRWGDLLFDVDNYDNKTHVFKGINNNGNEIPSGTYFYKIEFASGKSTATGYLEVKK